MEREANLRAFNLLALTSILKAAYNCPESNITAPLAQGIYDTLTEADFCFFKTP